MQANGQLGGDGTTAALLSLVSAEANIHGVKLRWLAPGGTLVAADIYRRARDTEWLRIAPIGPDGTGLITYDDRAVIAGVRYGYRIGVIEGGQQAFLGETWVDVPVTSELALAGFRSNPVHDNRSVAFSLVDASPARLELFDVGGGRSRRAKLGRSELAATS